MHFSTFFAAAFLGLSGVSASPGLTSRFLASDFSAANKYNAPITPWSPGAKPGWYDGTNGTAYPGTPVLAGPLCGILSVLPLDFLHCPTNTSLGNYHANFTGLSNATVAPSDYLTYGLVDTVIECKQMCDAVTNCTFVNSYYDVNGKGGRSQLTCSLFSKCHTSADNTNMGGQKQPNGTVDFIRNSDGYCKDQGGS